MSLIHIIMTIPYRGINVDQNSKPRNKCKYSIIYINASVRYLYQVNDLKTDPLRGRGHIFIYYTYQMYLTTFIKIHLTLIDNNDYTTQGKNIYSYHIYTLYIDLVIDIYII
jgi:hypothetical protein